MQPENKVVIEKTSKKYKLIMFLSGCLGLASCVGQVSSVSNNDHASFSLFTMLFVGSILSFVGTKMWAWWQHG